MSTEKIRILLIEDNRGDARLIHEMLAENNRKFSGERVYELHWEKTLGDGIAYGRSTGCSVILLDLSLPDSRGLSTFSALYKEIQSVPVIVLSGLDDEKTALEAVRQGAQDYLVKGDVSSSLLTRAMGYAITRQKEKQEREKLIGELESAIVKIRTLRGLIPICASCKKIRDDRGYWNQLESYIQSHSEAEFSHSYCPECLKNLYPEYID